MSVKASEEMLSNSHDEGYDREIESELFQAKLSSLDIYVLPEHSSTDRVRVTRALKRRMCTPRSSRFFHESIKVQSYRHQSPDNDMKNSGPATTKASRAGNLVNPTTTGTTVWHYAILIYLAANHLLTSNPRHVQYRESVRNAHKPIRNGGALHTSSAKDSIRSSFSQNPSPVYKHATFGGENKLHELPFRPPTPYGSSHQSPPYSSFQYDAAIPVPPLGRKSGYNQVETAGLSMAQMSDAWVRMKAVSRRPLRPVTRLPSSVDAKNKKVRKHVRWGSVQTYEWEHQYEMDDVADSALERRARDAGKGKKLPQTSDKEVEKNLEIWAPAKVGGEQEIWGPIEAESEHEIWGSTRDNTF
ncbi:Nn.00g041950.m01.CDS01 [Neocucurbitaria sp. VM-36]